MEEPTRESQRSLHEEIALAIRCRLLEERAAGRLRALTDHLREVPREHAAILERVYREVAAADVAEGPDAAPGDPGGRLGPYRLIRELGRGGQATVHLAEDTRLGRRVALKLLRGLGAGSEELMARFRREAAVTARLQHPGICAVYEAGVQDGTGWIAMQYVEGETLAQRLRAARETEGGDVSTVLVDGAGEPASASASSGTAEATPRTPSDRRAVLAVLELVERIARAIHAAHEAGIVHRDVKPGNVMITPSGRPVVLDFGLARMDAGDLPSLTLSGDVMGTPAYMSPEQIGGRRATIDHRTDVWSLGVVLFECLTLRRPFEAATREALYRSILADEPPDPRKLNTAVPDDVRVIVATALEKDSDQRYSSTLDLAEDLRRVREREPIHARPITRWRRLVRWSQRNPLVAGSIAATFLVLATGLVVALALLHQRDLALSSAIAERRRAQAAREGAESLAFFMLDDLSSRLLQVGRADIMAPVARKVREHYTRRPLDELDDAGRRSRVRALHSHGNVLDMMGDLDRAAAEFEQALAEALQARRERPEDPRIWSDASTVRLALADVRHKQRRLDEAQALVAKDASELERTVERLGRGPYLDRALALALLERAERRRDAEDVSAALTDHLRSLELLRGIEDPQAAGLSRQELAFATGQALVAVGRDLEALGRLDGARRRLRDAIRVFAELGRDAPEDLRWKREEAFARQQLADVLLEAGEPDAAAAEHEATERIFGALHASDPLNQETLRDLALAREKRGNALRALGRLGEAEKALRMAVTDFEELRRTSRDVALWRTDLAKCRLALAEVVKLQGRLPDAREEASAVVAVLDAADGSSSVDDLTTLAHAHMLLGQTATSIDEQARHMRASFTHAHRAHVANPDHLRLAYNVAASGSSFATMLLMKEAIDEARDVLRECREAFEPFVERDPSNPALVDQLCKLLRQLGDCALDSDNLRDALRHPSEAARWARRALEKRSGNSVLTYSLAKSLLRMSEAYTRRKEPGRALASSVPALEHMERVAETLTERPDVTETLATARLHVGLGLRNRATLAFGDRKHGAALRDARWAVELTEAAVLAMPRAAADLKERRAFLALLAERCAAASPIPEDVRREIDLARLVVVEPRELPPIVRSLGDDATIARLAAPAKLTVAAAAARVARDGGDEEAAGHARRLLATAVPAARARVEHLHEETGLETELDSAFLRARLAALQRNPAVRGLLGPAAHAEVFGGR